MFGYFESEKSEKSVGTNQEIKDSDILLLLNTVQFNLPEAS